MKMNLGELVKKLKSLDRVEKLMILELIAREGAKSITDVKKRLKLSFSTTYKYLNELEKAGFLTSKEVMEGGRKKRLFSLVPFKIELSQESLRGIESLEKGKKKYWLVDWESKLVELDLQELENVLLRSGAPGWIVRNVLRKLKKEVYDGITSLELRRLFMNILKEEEEGLKRVIECMESVDFLSRRRNFLTLLEEKGLGEIARHHLDGDYHIRNIGKPYPLGFQHDFSLILKHGLRIIGIETRPAKYWTSAISHLVDAAQAVQKDLADFKQSFDYLNLFLAPFVRDLTHEEIRQGVERIMYSFYKLFTINGIQTTLNLELSVPKHMKSYPAWVGGKEVGTLSDFEAEAHEILEAFFEVLEREKLQYPKLILKFRNLKEIDEIPSKILDKVYVANLTPRWQRDNANYLRDWCRFDSAWKGPKRSLRTAEIQMITLNLPRLYYLGRDEKGVLEALREKLEEVEKCFSLSMVYLQSELFGKKTFLLRKYKEDKYCHLDDSIFLVGIVGMKDLMENLGIKLSEDQSLAIKILKLIRERFKEIGMRVGIIENNFFPVKRRFAKQDSLSFGSRKRIYKGGIEVELADEEKIKYCEKLHPLLNGGHMCKLRKMNKQILRKVLNSNVGLACCEKALLKP